MRLTPKPKCRAYRCRDRLISEVETLLESFVVKPDLCKRSVHWVAVPVSDESLNLGWTAVFVLGPDAMFMARTIAERGFFVTNC